MTDEGRTERRVGLPRRTVTVNMLVAYNTASLRRAAGLTQKQLGDRVGLSEASVSAAERSWDGKRVREFDADETVRIAVALGVPLLALLLPPPDAGTVTDYTFTVGAALEIDMMGLLTAVLPGLRPVDSPAMEAYRDRILALGRESRYDLPLTGELDVILSAASFAQALKRDAQHRHHQALSVLVSEREALERRVTDLRGFEREYRSRLIAYLEAELRHLRAGVYPAGDTPRASPRSAGRGDAEP